MQVEEISDLETRISAAAAAIASTEFAALPGAVEFIRTASDTLPPLLLGVCIGIARDNAFSFICSANLDVLKAMGATLVFFSLLADAVLPDVDSIYLPGGYPELHLPTLRDNVVMKAALQDYFQQGKPIYAECGGMLYLLESMMNKAGGMRKKWLVYCLDALLCKTACKVWVINPRRCQAARYAAIRFTIRRSKHRWFFSHTVSVYTIFHRVKLFFS